MEKDENILKSEFPEKVGRTFSELKTWAYKVGIAPLTQVGTKSVGRGGLSGLYSLKQALEYKKQKEAIRPAQLDVLAAKALREGGK